MKTTDLAELLDVPKLSAYVTRVEQQVHDRLAAAHPAIAKPALRILHGSGKRFRPMLVIATSASQGARIGADAITAATAIELAHLGSLVHDDMIDHAELRGGVQTIHRKEGTESAILVGDYLLAAASREAASVNSRVGSIMSRAITDMCEGQIQEMVDTYNVQRSIADYRSCIDNKTGALISAACEAGGVCAKAPDSVCTALRKYGQAFGVAYQLLDDLLDFVATTKTMGKPVHNDIKEGVYTLPLLLSLDGPSATFIKPWLGKNPKRPVAYREIINRLLRDGSFTETIDEVKLQNKRATDALKGVSADGLKQLPEYYLREALYKQTVLNRHM